MYRGRNTNEKCQKNLMLAEVYRIPNTPVRESLSRYDDLMNKLVASKCVIMLATDQNIDYCKVDTSSSASDLLDIFTTLGTLPTVTIPTRVTHCSATLIDNIYISSLTNTKI